MMILETLKDLYERRYDEVEAWLGAQRRLAAPHFTSSVDLRHSGVRLAPVDTNLYPAGFNNLSVNAGKRAAARIRSYLNEHYPMAERVLIIPENHTRNLPYLDNLAMLSFLFRSAGLEVQFGSLQALAGEPVRLQAPSGMEIIEQPLLRSGNRLVTESGFAPDIVFLNNDFTSGPSALLEGIAQPVLPPMAMGWYQRRKSVHFAAYRALSGEFASAFGLDPWLLSARFHACGAIDFKERQGVDCLAKAVDELIEGARAKHKEYGIAEDPYVFVKADSGTYGMGIMTVHDGSELLEMNKKERNKMHVIKEGAHVSEVIIQEGIPTIDQVEGHFAEPMIYLIDGIPVGGMYRVNENRDAQSNLNAAGMRFTGMCDEMETVFDCRQPVRDCHFTAYGLVAVLAALAAGRERYAAEDERMVAMERLA